MPRPVFRRAPIWPQPRCKPEIVDEESIGVSSKGSEVVCGSENRLSAPKGHIPSQSHASRIFVCGILLPHSVVSVFGDRVSISALE